MTPRELDALVAQHILSWTDVERHHSRLGDYWRGSDPKDDGATWEIPRFSEDISWAYDAVNQLVSEQYSVAVLVGPDGSTAAITLAGDIKAFVPDPVPARAICLAALKAKDVEFPK